MHGWACAILSASLVLSACQQRVGVAAPLGAEPAEDAGTLSDAGTMNTARAVHTATPLPDGRILLAGGTADRDASAEIFDLESGEFAPAALMTTTRQSHTATVLPDGRVLLAGGYGPGNVYLASTEIYDPASGAFAPAGEMTTARAGHVAVALSGGRILLAGGVGTGWTFLASAEIYDPATGSFASTGSMSVPRESHSAVRLADGRVLVIGGHRGRRANIELFTSAEIYDPEAGTFSPAGDMNVRRHKHDAELLPDGRVLITGGADERDSRGQYSSAEVFDPEMGSASPIGPMQLARYKHEGTSVPLAGGRVLLAGGATRAEVFDAETGDFLLVGGEARMMGQFSAGAPLPDGRVLVTGGYGGGRGAQPQAWVYTPPASF